MKWRKRIAEITPKKVASRATRLATFFALANHQSRTAEKIRRDGCYAVGSRFFIVRVAPPKTGKEPSEWGRNMIASPPFEASLYSADKSEKGLGLMIKLLENKCLTIKGWDMFTSATTQRELRCGDENKRLLCRRTGNELQWPLLF